MDTLNTDKSDITEVYATSTDHTEDTIIPILKSDSETQKYKNVGDDLKNENLTNSSEGNINMEAYSENVKHDGSKETEDMEDHGNLNKQTDLKEEDNLDILVGKGNDTDCNVNCDIHENQAVNESELSKDKLDSEPEYFSDQSESGDEYESAEEGEEVQADTAHLKEVEEQLTEEEKEERQVSAKDYKEEGNQLFRDGSYKSAIRMYSRGLRICPLKYEKDRAVLYANRAACKVKLEEFEDAIKDCSKALDLNPDYMKALSRRAELYEKTEKLDEALADYQKILELDPSQHKARAACNKLPEMIKERNEKLKEEMMGKLKELGNMVLRPFGLSTNNFKMQQDPNTGSYSVNFVQSADNNS